MAAGPCGYESKSMALIRKMVTKCALQGIGSLDVNDLCSIPETAPCSLEKSDGLFSERRKVGGSSGRIPVHTVEGESWNNNRG